MEESNGNKHQSPPPPNPTLEEDPATTLRRRLSDKGKDLLREGLEAKGSVQRKTISTGTVILNQEDTLRKVRHKDAPNEARFTLVKPLHNSDSKFHQRAPSVSSSDEEEEGEEPLISGLLTGMETVMEVATTERPMKGLEVPLYNPVDQSQIVPPPERTFTREPLIITHMWRDDNAADKAVTFRGQSATNSPVDALRRSIALSRRSITNAAGSLSNVSSSELESPSASIGRRKLSEKRLVSSAEKEKESDKVIDLAKQGLGSDFTLFNRDWSVLLRGKRSSARWSQLHHRHKHADIVFYFGSVGEIPIATLKGGARASRVLLLERQSDGGIVYTMVKEKVGQHRLFWIAEGRRPNGVVNPNECRFVLVIRSGRAVVKSRDTSLLVPHLASARASLTSFSSSFSTTVVDFVDRGGESVVKIASGMDAVLAFACLIIADRFQHYSCFDSNEKTRKEVMNERFETGVGEEELDVFQQLRAQSLAHGTTLAANALMY